MIRRTIAVALAGLVATATARADSISFADGQPDPNPGGKRQAMAVKGTFATDADATVERVVVFARGPSPASPNQVSSGPATISGAAWEIQMPVAEGEFEVWAELRTVSRKAGRTTTATKHVRVTVARLPKAPPPRLISVLRVDGNAVLYRDFTTTPGGPGRPEPAAVAGRFALDTGAVRDTDGKPLSAEAARARLVPGEVVVLAADATPVDPAYLKALARDVLVLVPPAQPPAGNPGK